MGLFGLPDIFLHTIIEKQRSVRWKQFSQSFSRTLIFRKEQGCRERNITLLLQLYSEDTRAFVDSSKYNVSFKLWLKLLTCFQDF